MIIRPGIFDSAAGYYFDNLVEKFEFDGNLNPTFESSIYFNALNVGPYVQGLFDQAVDCSMSGNIVMIRYVPFDEYAKSINIWFLIEIMPDPKNNAIFYHNGLSIMLADSSLRFYQNPGLGGGSINGYYDYNIEEGIWYNLSIIRESPGATVFINDTSVFYTDVSLVSDNQDPAVFHISLGGNTTSWGMPGQKILFDRLRIFDTKITDTIIERILKESV